MNPTLKSVLKIMTLSFALIASTSLQAAESKSSALLYISPNDFNYSVHLLHPYFDYWFAQGPLLEPIALAALKSKDSEINLCTANETADTIIRVKPSLFYNPQMRVYHSKLVATVYSGSGNVMGTYTGEAQQLGSTSVDVGINNSLNKVYTLAMQDLMTKLKTEKITDSAKSENKLPCGLIGGQLESKINFY